MFFVECPVRFRGLLKLLFKEIDMFEQATRLKLRFALPGLNISTEDLWDLPLTSPRGVSLDDLAKSINREVKAHDEESFVVKSSPADNGLTLKLDIVKRVIEFRLDAIEASNIAAENKAKREKIVDILCDKEHDSLKRKSQSDLRKMLDDLSAG